MCNVDWLSSYIMLQCSHCKRCTSYCNSVRPSIRPSVTRQYCVKSTACSTVQNVSSFVETKKYTQGRPLPLKSWFILTYPFLIAVSLDTFCLVFSALISQNYCFVVEGGITLMLNKTGNSRLFARISGQHG